MTDSKRLVDSDQSAGSPSAGEPAFLVIGKLHRPHGVRGEINFQIYTDFPERIQPGAVLYIGNQHTPLKVASSRMHQNGLLVRFESIKDRDEAGELRNELVYVRADDRPDLPDGEYYHHQLLALDVVTTEGTRLGQIETILDTGANDVFVVKSATGGEVLIPYTDEIVQLVDIPGKRILVRLLPGLMPS